MAQPEGADRDLILVHGIEPNMRWRAFCDELVERLHRAGRRAGDPARRAARRLTAHPAGAGHRGRHRRRLAAQLHVEPVDYKGPTGIVGVLQHACAAAGIPSVSLWAAVPHYVAQPPSPKATLALLRGVEDVLDTTLPLADLPEEARAWERGVDELAEQDTEVAEYVKTLEEAKDATDLPEASGDAIAREFERYLRRRGNRGGERS